ncbi:hypothetical protein BV20DRAFT_957171 [Pilatotrama ljubarskyi]|nr:hypothetical protein BV20DRAFT_957171 [Pilatotrama ljubarskyi]
MRPENVFRGHSADDMRRHICLLSAALARCPDGQPTSSSLTDSDPRLRKKFNLLQHLATLLTIGTDRDKNAAAVNAVTGSIEPGRIVSVIATRNAHALPNATSDAEIVKLETGNGQDGMASELLTNWFESSGKVDIDQHLREVTAILSYILQRPAPDRPSLEGPFAAWITHRAFMKLAARIENAQQIWGTYPAELMRMWSAHDSSDKMPVYNVSFSNPPSALLVKRLPHYGIQPDDSEGSATSSSHPRFLGPAKAWLSVLVDVLDALQSILTPSGKRVDDSKLDDGKILTMVLELGVLSQMLNSTLLQELRESTFNHKLQMRYDEWQKAKHKTWSKLFGSMILIKI